MVNEYRGFDKYRNAILYGSLYRTFLHLATPLILLEIVNVSYSLVDAYWLSLWGDPTFAISRLTRPTYMFFEAFFIGLSASNLALMSQFIGSGRYDEASNIFEQYLTISTIT